MACCCSDRGSASLYLKLPAGYVENTSDISSNAAGTSSMTVVVAAVAVVVVLVVLAAVMSAVVAVAGTVVVNDVVAAGALAAVNNVDEGEAGGNGVPSSKLWRELKCRSASTRRLNPAAQPKQ